ncbi:NAD(P)H-dependent flavin oxidoreductase [Planosporangium mesophilum]|nr:nitronate monooxygenase [Planosporangium mesophilum]NJC85302.1 nitronate monooxygenase [Planosporangium mesophilum]
MPISTRLTREYGIRHPLVSAGMGFVSYEGLAAAVSSAGGLGVLGASPDPVPSLQSMVGRIRDLTDKPWGVGLICAETAFGPASTPEHVAACVELRVPLVVFHHDVPPAEWISRLRSAGIKVWMQVSSVDLAAQAMAAGVDGLIAQGREAGGHVRAVSSRAQLLSAIRQRFPEALLLGAGGISTGENVAATLNEGADGVWVGTRFVASVEAYANEEYKQRLVRSDGATIVTKVFGPEWPDQSYRVLATPFAVEADANPPAEFTQGAPIGHTTLFPHSAKLPYDMPRYSNLPPSVDTTGDWDLMVYPAGTGVGAITSIDPAARIVDEMMGQAENLLDS